MGGTYANMVLRDAQPDRVADFLRRQKRVAIVAYDANDYPVVFEQESERSFDAGFKLALDMSIHLHCTALYVGLYDNDVMVYELYRNGAKMARYDSWPGYFEEPIGIGLSDWESANSSKPPPPTGSDAGKLCSAFSAEPSLALVERILRSEDYVFAIDRHQALVTALGLPAFTVCNGYNNVAKGAILNGRDTVRLIRIQPEP